MRLPALFLFLLVWLTGCREGVPEAADPSDYLPESTLLVLRIHHSDALRSALQNNSLLEQLRTGNPASPIEIAHKQVLPLDFGESALVAFTRERDTALGWVAIFEEPGMVRPDSLGQETGPTPPAWMLPDSTTLFTQRVGKWRMVGTSQVLLEQAISSGKTESGGLKKALRTTNNQAAASLVYPRTALHPLEVLLEGKIPPSITDRMEPWTAFDLKMESDALLVQGLEIRPDSLWDNRKLFRGAPVLPLDELLEVTPSGATSLVGYSLLDPGQFLENQRGLLGHENPQNTLAEGVEQLARYSWEGKPYLVLRALNPDNLSEVFRSQQGEGTEFQTAALYSLQSDQALQEAFQPLLNEAPQWTWYARMGSHFIFSTDREGLENAISALNRKNTYLETPAYQSLREYLPSSATVMAMGSQAAPSDPLTNPEAALYLPEAIAARLPETYLFTAQLNSSEAFDLLEYQFRKKDDPSGGGTGVSQVLSLPLDGRVQAGPFFLKNHRTGEMDIAVQDDNNQFYLFSNTGSLFWKKELPGPIQGTIHQVDLYRNNRLQMAFNLPDRLVVLDRNGERVAPFPLEFEGGNLGPLAVFDYEGTRNYRLVFSQGSNILMYDGQGRAVRGFKYRDAGSPLLGPARHFRIGSRDYLVFALEDGRLEIRNRVGDTRVRVKETFNFSQNGVYLYRNTFAFTDREGHLVTIDPSGRVSRTPMNLNADHGIFATARTLAVMNDNIFQVKGNRAELDLGVYTAPEIFYLNDIIYVSVTDIQSQKVFLFRSNAAALPGFPVEGNGQPDMADMDNDRNPELAVRFRDSTVAVYRLQR
ncbi:hypothetical protein [Robiginitalea sediminis]|uniref:hypothetical protein n=1 Tax=Robiginitalea sediminis TaxID=1982593 RepID=UPI000B4BA75E|nr:hypothetical protein [Robiginitalea sediminis]